MALTIHLWAFALLPFLLLLAALFWGAPAIALVSELIGLVSGKPFPARAARQLSRLAVMGHALFWAVFSGLYGLCFGGLCAAVYLFAKTPAFALSWWLSGLSYDALHGVGNFAIMLVLYRPLRKALKAAKRQIGY